MTLPATRRFSVPEYHLMIQAGILDENDRVELIDGEIIEMAAVGDRHAACTTRGQRFFERAVGDEALVRIQQPLRLGNYSEPEPDLALVRFDPDFYDRGHPAASDVLLVVEVADTSIRFDRRVKAPMYARSGIPELWIVDLISDTISVYLDPAGGRYRTVQTYRRGETITPSLILHIPVEVNRLLPSPA